MKLFHFILTIPLFVMIETPIWLRLAYLERGFYAFGGEWILIFACAAAYIVGGIKLVCRNRH